MDHQELCTDFTIWKTRWNRNFYNFAIYFNYIKLNNAEASLEVSNGLNFLFPTKGSVN